MGIPIDFGGNVLNILRTSTIVDTDLHPSFGLTFL